MSSSRLPPITPTSNNGTVHNPAISLSWSACTSTHKYIFQHGEFYSSFLRARDDRVRCSVSIAFSPPTQPNGCAAKMTKLRPVIGVFLLPEAVCSNLPIAKSGVLRCACTSQSMCVVYGSRQNKTLREDLAMCLKLAKRFLIVSKNNLTFFIRSLLTSRLIMVKDFSLEVLHSKAYKLSLLHFVTLHCLITRNICRKGAK